MQRNRILLIAGLLAAAGGVSAVAAVGDRGEGGWRGGFGMGGWHRHHGGGKHDGFGHDGFGGSLLRLDADKDGDVTLAEFMKPHEERFAALDTNKDGVLDTAELTATMKAKAGDRLEKMFKRLDANGDGKISREEFALGSAGAMAEHGPRGGHGRHGMDGHGKGGHGWGGRMDEDKAEAAPPSDAPKDQTAPQKQAEASAAPQDGEGERGRNGWRGRHHGMGMMGEGRAEGRDGGRARFVANVEERFKALDKNGDGFIDKAEMETAQADEIAYRVKRMMHALDRDKDGKITRDEFLARSKDRFAQLDLNDDGKITADDMPPSQRGAWKQR